MRLVICIKQYSISFNWVALEKHKNSHTCGEIWSGLWSVSPSTTMADNGTVLLEMSDHQDYLIVGAYSLMCFGE